MANLGKKDGVFHIRFRFLGKEYKRSLKTRDDGAAAAALHVIELTIHRLLTGQIMLPHEMDAGDFIVCGGAPLNPIKQPAPQAPVPTLRELAELFTKSQENFIAPSYHYSQAMHLRHLVRHLGRLADNSCDRITFRDLDGYIKTRLADRHPNTVERERITLLQFFKWTVIQEYLPTSPAAKLERIKGGEDRAPFRTISEVDIIIQRGRLSKAETRELWECLYLSPNEIASLLDSVRANAQIDYSYLLHAIPAYTGMRRGEVLRLTWSDIDLNDDFMIARSRKQSRRKSESCRRIDLHPELKNELISWRQRRPKGQFVICESKTFNCISNDRSNRVFWQPMRGTEWCLDSKKNWFKVGFHTYRHSFASNLAAAGVDQRIIDQWMGHQTEEMRQRYRHLFPRDRRSAIETFSLQSAGHD